ncbi:nuclease harbi1-like [Moniliophthora roreri MCA 2997]|uniref:Nuclease harbi1-like n=1 Tax=Moniliophthora roreri (strain MCA 2997) TaxID=1381753 RepID=V2XU80_MONRO|nr:nuclease harbi1-like [Moniliophthora roreri MCA 2997]
MLEHLTPQDLGHIMASAASVVNLAVLGASIYASQATKQPYHNSALSGYAWVQELMKGHPRCIYTELGVRLHVFITLVITLCSMSYADSQKGVTVEEQLAIFLYMCVTGLSVRHVGERFQWANGTITHYFCLMCEALSGPEFYNQYVSLPNADDPPSPYLNNNPKFWPFFKGCLGALDGSHIASSPAAADQSNSRNRKGFVSQNILAACSFLLQFLCADRRVAITLGMQVLLVQQRPQSKEELFNLRHAQARNVIEHIFGVIKWQWRILVLPPEFSMKIQAQIPAALAALHNFILEHNDNFLQEL